jgi:exosome complex RNA-binding protein Rrp42 (RNase PH superfamily)
LGTHFPFSPLTQDNAVPLLSKKDWWKLPIIITANQVDKTIFFDATASEILVTQNRYAIATVPLNSVSTKRKVVFCQSVGTVDGYGAGRGIERGELTRMVRAVMDVCEDVVEAADKEVERLAEE